jgi:hypothetical protein
LGVYWSNLGPVYPQEGLQQRLDASVAWMKDGELSRWKRKSLTRLRERKGEKERGCTVL